MDAHTPHRHVFFADAPGAAEEWTCACGVVALRDGDLDGALVVIATPAPDDFGALRGAEPDPLADLLGARRVGGVRRSA